MVRPTDIGLNAPYGARCFLPQEVGLRSILTVVAMS